MMHVVMMVVMVMVVMVVVNRRGHGSRSRRGRSGFLRDGVTGEAERERGGCDNGFDHGKVFLSLREPQRVIGDHRVCCLNSI
jgi:hypothetical protein